jgi:hypothetical protein
VKYSNLNKIYLILIVIIVNSCEIFENETDLNESAKELVTITLKLGELDPDLVDSYIGLQKLDSNEEIRLELIEKDLKNLFYDINKTKPDNDISLLRKNYQLAILNSLKYRIKFLKGDKVEFLKECEKIYQYKPSLRPISYYDSLLVELDSLIPGEGNLIDRYSKYRHKFIVKNDHLDGSFRKALDYAALKTKEYIEMPIEEGVTIEYMEGAPWSAYNWYKGNYNSLIQVNKSVDIHFEKILDLAAHESYPGHHVYYTKREKNFYKDSGFVEFSIYPLYSPVSFLAEGTAEYGIDLVFPENEKIDYIYNNLVNDEEVSKDDLKKYISILDIFEKLDEVIINISQKYLDGEIIIEEAVRMLRKYGLESEISAIRRMNFVRRYRSYIINYTLGKRFVKNYIEKHADNEESKWDIYKDLIEKPYLPNDLITDTLDYSSI